MQIQSAMSHLGIIPLKKVDGLGIPNYLEIAVKWYIHYEKTGEQFALMNYQYYIRVAEEFDLCHVEDMDTFS